MEEKLIKYFSGELGQSDTSELFNELKTNELLREEFVRMQNAYALTHLSPISINEEEGKKSYSLFMRQQRLKKQHRTIRLVLQYAATALILITSTFYLTRNFYDQYAENNTLYVPAGQRAQLTLQDGTTVWLNAQSTLTYPSRFSGKTREVNIVGEAYFDVAKNRKKPFVVTSQDITMKVLGTEFNIYSYPDMGYIQTDLVEGSLKVYKNDMENTSITLKPNERLTITSDKMILQHISNSDYFLWKEGIYTFNNARLIDIIEKLQLYYDVKIIVNDPEIFNVRYTGKFRQRDGIEEILKIIQKIRKFHIEKDTENNIITLSK